MHQTNLDAPIALASAFGLVAVRKTTRTFG
jgi:hypothetical protein